MSQKKQIASLLKSHKEILAAYLFGSQSTGKAGVMSDIDIGLLIDRSVSASKRAAFLSKVFAELSLTLQTDFIDITDLHSAPELLRYNAITKGHLLFTKNRRLTNEFVIRAIQQFEDFRYHLETQTQLIQRKIATYVAN